MFTLHYVGWMSLCDHFHLWLLDKKVMNSLTQSMCSDLREWRVWTSIHPGARRWHFCVGLRREEGDDELWSTRQSSTYVQVPYVHALSSFSVLSISCINPSLLLLCWKLAHQWDRGGCWIRLSLHLYRRKLDHNQCKRSHGLREIPVQGR